MVSAVQTRENWVRTLGQEQRGSFSLLPLLKLQTGKEVCLSCVFSFVFSVLSYQLNLKGLFKTLKMPVSLYNLGNLTQSV